MKHIEIHENWCSFHMYRNKCNCNSAARAALKQSLKLCLIRQRIRNQNALSYPANFQYTGNIN